MKSGSQHPNDTKSKLYWLFFFYAIFFILFDLFLLTQGYLQKQAPTEIKINWLPSIVALNEINTSVIDYRVSEVLHVLSATTNEKNELEDEQQRISNNITNWRNKYEPVISSEKEKKLYQKFYTHYDDYRVLSKQLLALSQNNETEKAGSHLKKTRDLINNVNHYLTDLIDLNNEGAKQTSATGDVVFTRAKWLIMVSSLIMLAVTFVLAFLAVMILKRANVNIVPCLWTKIRVPFVFLILVILNGSFSWIVSTKMAALNQQATQLTRNWLPSIIVINKISGDVGNYRRAQAMHILMSNEMDMQLREKDMKDVSVRLQKDFKQYERLISSNRERDIYNQFTIAYKEYLANSREIIALSHNQQKEKATALLKQGGVLFDDFANSLTELSDLNEQASEETTEKIEATYKQIKIAIVDGGLIFLMLLVNSAQILDLWATPPLPKKININKKAKIQFFPKVLSIKLKLRFAFWGLVGLFMTFSFLVNILMTDINKESVEIGENWMPSIVAANAISISANHYRIAEAQHILSTNPIQKSRWEKDIARQARKIQELRHHYLKLISSDEEQNFYQDFCQLYDQYVIASNHAILLSRQNNSEQARIEFEHSGVTHNALTIALDKLVKLNERGGNAGIYNSSRLFHESSQIRLFLTLIVFMVTTTLVILFEKNIAYPLQRLTLWAQSLANGNITRNDSFIGRKDELGQMANAVSEITQTLQNLIDDALELIEAARAGILSSRIEAGAHPGDFNKIVFGMNQLLEVLSQPLSEVAQVMQNLALGDLGGRIQGNYEGELRALKVNVNRSLDALVSLLSELGTISQLMANGNLSQHLSGNYQGEFSVLKANMNQTIHQLKEILQIILTNTATSASAITQTSEASLYVAKEVSLQKIALDDIARTIEETSQSINEVSHSATKGNELACATSQAAHIGQDQLNKLLALIQHVAAEYNKIEQITGEITRIADKTHLLSLNAGLEAMRAGEHGLGFGFVAQQIGKLAEEVGISARNIGAVINSSAESVHQGVIATQETRSVMEQISHSAQASEQTVQAIFAAIVEQSTAVELLSKRVSEIQDGSKSTASAADEISVTMIHLAQTIRQTATEAQRFTLS